jgi:apolipoprotein N-acyltransferase
MIHMKSDGKHFPDNQTLYARCGDWFAQVCCLISFLAVFIAVIRKTSVI